MLICIYVVGKMTWQHPKGMMKFMHLFTSLRTWTCVQHFYFQFLGYF